MSSHGYSKTSLYPWPSFRRVHLNGGRGPKDKLQLIAPELEAQQTNFEGQLVAVLIGRSEKPRG